MVRQTFDTLCQLAHEAENGTKEQQLHLRRCLSGLRAQCHEEAECQALLYYLDEQKRACLMELLKAPDAKTRKNAALLLGQLGSREFLPALFEAYKEERQLFVKSAYLQAMLAYDFRPYTEQFKKRKEWIEREPHEESEKKHLHEEYHLLAEMLLMAEGTKHHEFRGYYEPSDMLLMTNRNYDEITLAELAEKGITDAQALGVGVWVRTDNLHPVLECRTCQEFLFFLPLKERGQGENNPLSGKLSMADNVIPGLVTERSIYPETDSSAIYEEKAALVLAAQSMIGAGIVEFMEKRHKGKAPFYFRIEWKGKLEPSKKGIFIRRFAAQLEEASGHRLVNSAGNYELELRIIENSKGRFHLLLKLFSLPDERFSYRRNSIAGSVRPYRAALTAALVKDYLKEDAKILDPFCGVGTMLIERHKYKKANTMYGIDLYGKAIEGAKENTERAHQIIHYIHKDFFDFTHQYLFDEVFTNMPMVGGKQTENEIEKFYQKFFKAVGRHLTENGIVILYTHNREFAEQYAQVNGFSFLESFEISKKEGCFVEVFKNRYSLK